MDKAIFRNFAINFTGLILPTFVSLVTVPAYIKLLGVERYGIIALVGVYITYFSMLDLGMGIATENRVSRSRQAHYGEDIERVLWSACWTNLVTGVLGGLAIYVAARLYVPHMNAVPMTCYDELDAALPWLALGVPAANIATVFSAAISGAQRFGVLNATQTLGTFLEQLAPLAAIYLLGPTLQVVLATIIIVRIGTAIALGLATAKTLRVRAIRAPSWKTVRDLFGYGSWITLANAITTVFETLDAVLVGAAMGARFVTYYNVPQNLVARFSLLPLSLTRTLFPRLVSCEREHADTLVQQSMTFLTALFTPIAIVAMFAIGPFLDLWVGHDLSVVSSPVGRTLMIAVWLAGQSNVIRVLMQAHTSPATVARLGLFELPFFAAALWLAITHFGITGASLTVVARGFIDYAILIYLSGIRARAIVSDMLLHLAFLGASLLLANTIAALPLLAATGVLLLIANACVSLYRFPMLRDMAWALCVRFSAKKSA